MGKPYNIIWNYNIVAQIIYDSVMRFSCYCNRVVVAEWLRRQTRNLLGSARAGSNPAGDAVFFFLFLFFVKLTFYMSVVIVIDIVSVQNLLAQFCSPAWWSWQAVLNFSHISIKVKKQIKNFNRTANNILACAEAGQGICLLYE